MFVCFFAIVPLLNATNNNIYGTIIKQINMKGDKKTERHLSVVAYSTHKRFAKKYKIPVSYRDINGGRKLKTMKELRSKIYEHESRNNVSDGLYF